MIVKYVPFSSPISAGSRGIPFSEVDGPGVGVVTERVHTVGTLKISTPPTDHMHMHIYVWQRKFYMSGI